VVTTPAIFELGDDGSVVQLGRDEFSPAPGPGSTSES
jgi:hypothetical protein